MIRNGDPDNHLDIVQLLIDRRLDLNQYDEIGLTALMLVGLNIPGSQHFSVCATVMELSHFLGKIT